MVVKRWFHECLAALKTRWRADIVAISPSINIIIPDRWQNNREQTGAPGARARLTPDTLMNIQLFDRKEKKKPPPLFPRRGVNANLNRIECCAVLQGHVPLDISLSSFSLPTRFSFFLSFFPPPPPAFYGVHLSRGAFYPRNK